MISAENLWKKYGELWALQGLSFEVNAGSVFGLIGPNGAGKTTALRILATVLPPTFGEARVGGRSAVREPEAVRPILGFMPERFGLYEEMRVEEYLEFFARAYCMGRSETERTVDQVVELTDLDGKREEMLGSLSKGLRQRVLLAKSLVHDPRVLLLDEPASGLDPRARIELRSMLRTLAQMGKTVIVSSHILSELGEMCDAVGIMERGRMVLSGSLDEIEARLSPSRKIELAFAGRPDVVERVLARFPCVESPRVERERASFLCSGQDGERASIVAALVGEGVGVVDFHASSTGLEGVFLRVSQGGPT